MKNLFSQHPHMTYGGLVTLQQYSPPARCPKLEALVLGCVLLAALLVVSAAHARQGPANKAMKLVKIEFSGLQTHSEDKAIAASGLQIGQAVDIPTLDAAAEKLLTSGLFKKLSYRYRTTGNQATVIFQVEEEKGAVLPVVFDNFIWFTEEELLNAIRGHVPTFDGTAADSAIDGITNALRALLQERKLPGRIEYAPSENLATGRAEHIFSVEDVNIPICSVDFSGAAGVQESHLVKHSTALIKTDYRRSFVLSFAQANLIPIYRERGHLRATFPISIAKLVTDDKSKCADGVTVTLAVEEGLVYSWNKSEWTGNAALSVQELEAALGMKLGELANGLKIDKGIKSILTAYGRQGYLESRVRPAPEFDDANQRVTYRVALKEGPQYKMGTFTITGLPENVANGLNRKWKMQSGEVYDASYIDDFLKKELVFNAAEMSLLPKSIGSDVKPDRQKLTVDVVLTFK